MCPSSNKELYNFPVTEYTHSQYGSSGMVYTDGHAIHSRADAEFLGADDDVPADALLHARAPLCGHSALSFRDFAVQRVGYFSPDDGVRHAL